MNKFDVLKKQFGLKYDEKDFNRLKEVVGISVDNPVYSVKDALGIAKAVEDEDGNASDTQFEFKINSQEEDRDGDVIEQTGLDFDNVGKNMPALWAHEHNWVIGHWVKMWLGKDGDARGIVDINPEAIVPGTSINIVNAVKRGDISAVSIGMIIKSFEWIDPEEYWSGILIKEAEIIECSLCAVPANQNALINEGKSLEEKTKGGVEMENTNVEEVIDNTSEITDETKAIVDETIDNSTTDSTENTSEEKTVEETVEETVTEEENTDAVEDTPAEEVVDIEKVLSDFKSSLLSEVKSMLEETVKSLSVTEEETTDEPNEEDEVVFTITETEEEKAKTEKEVFKASLLNSVKIGG